MESLISSNVNDDALQQRWCVDETEKDRVKMVFYGTIVA